MTIERAISEVMQIYGYLSPDKQQALDVLIQEKIKDPDKMQDVLDTIKAEIEQKIEQERFARSVFRDEEKDDDKAEQCTGSIFAYNNVIKLIDKYRGEA